MTESSSVAVVLAATLVTLVVWAAIPAFPASPQLFDLPLSELDAKFGPGTVEPSSGRPLSMAKSVVWSKSRGIAVWKLQADWVKTPVNEAQPPDGVSQTLFIPWLNASLPRDMVVHARVMVPNQRLERP